MYDAWKRYIVVLIHWLMAERNIQEVIFLKLLGHKSVLIMAIILNQTIIIIRNIQTHFIAVFFLFLEFAWHV